MPPAPATAALLEQGCETEKREKLCRSRGGESCAFDGAAIVLMPVADAAHVVHGPITCAGASWETRGVLSTHGELTHRGLTTAMTGLDVVYGSERLLASAIREAYERFRPKAVFVYATCVSGLIGEDIDAVCRASAEELGVPVIAVNAPGFVGPKNLGNRIAGEVLVKLVIGTGEPVYTTPTDLTLIGEYNVAGDLWLLEPLLRRAGIRLLSRVTGDASFEELTYAHRAKLSAVVCSRALVNVARHLERAYGMPYVEVSFFGPTEVARSLRAIADGLEAASPEARGVGERVEALIAEEEARLAASAAFASDRATLARHRAVLYSGGVKTWSMVSALMDLGVEVVAVGTKKASHEDEEKVRAILPDVPLHEDITPACIRSLMADSGADILVAGGRNQYLAAKEGWAFVDVNQERHSAYAGYEGFENLAADLAASVRFYAPKPPAAPLIVERDRACVVDPLGHPASLGAALAIQGVHCAIPLLHGAQGCSFLGKVLLTRHFREPIALATTRLFAEDVVLGDETVVTAAVEKLAGQGDPELIAVVPSALAEVKGDDVAAAVRRCGARAEVVAVGGSDLDGGLEDGYAAAVAALVSLAADDVGEVVPDRVTILAGSHLTPADFVEIRELAEEFGLDPVLVPDLGALDGSREGFGPHACGGVSVPQLRGLGGSAHTLVLGGSLAPVAQELRARFGTPFTVSDGPFSLAGTDRLLETLSALSGMPVPARRQRQRARLADAMRDMQAYVAGRSACVALEPDHAAALCDLLDELGMDVPLAVIPARTPAAERIRAARVVIGDFADIEAADVVVGNSHAAATAARLGAAHLPLGFPLFGVVGAAHTLTVGYAGALATAEAIAQRLYESRTHHEKGDVR